MAKHANSKETLSSRDYCTRIMNTLNEQRHEGTLCDVTLIAEKTSFLAHRNVLAAGSSYFDKLFTSDLAEKAQEIITFELKHLALSRSVMDDLLRYFYTGNLNILASTAQDLLIAGDYFLVPELKTAAAEVLESMVTGENCLLVQHLAERFNSDKLFAAARMFVEKHFSTVRHTSEFLNLTFQQIEVLISSDDLVLCEEGEVFEAILVWSNHSEDNRKLYFEELFSQVRLQSLENEYIHFKVLGSDLVQSNTKCVQLVENVLKSRLESAALPNANKYPLQYPRKCLQPSIEIVLTCGGMSPLKPNHSELTRCYVPGEDVWHELAPMSSKRNWHGVASFEDSFFVFGGEKDGLSTSSCEKFDFVSNSWEEISPMFRETIFPAVAELGGLLYIIGSVRNNRARLQIYNPRTNRWAYGACLSVAREMTCAVAKAPFIYAIGGLQTDIVAYMSSVEKFDPESDCWISVSGMLHPRAGASGVALNNRIYAIGGEYDVRIGHSSCETYNIDSDEWESIGRMSVPRYFAGAAVVADGFYVFGGVGGANVNPEQKRTVDYYSIITNRWTSDVTMPWRERYCRCSTIRTRIHHLRGLPWIPNDKD